MEKILLNFQEEEYKKKLNRIGWSRQTAEEGLQKLMLNCKLEPKDYSLVDLFQGHGDRTASDISQRARGEFAKAGITIESVINSAITSEFEVFYPILKEVKPRVGAEQIPYLLVNGKGEVSIKSGIEDKIKEEFCTYITTERGKEIFEIYKILVDALNDFKNFVPSIRRASINDYVGIKYDTGKASMLPLRYDQL